MGSCCGRRRRCRVRRPCELGRTEDNRWHFTPGAGSTRRAGAQPAGEEDALALGHAAGLPPQPGQPLEEQRERDPQLEPGERRSDAEVDAFPERDVAAEVGAARVEAVGVGELALVAVRRGEVHHDARLGRQLDASELDRTGRLAEESLRGRLQAQHLLDQRRQELGGLVQGADLLGVVEQQRKRAADRARHGDVARHDEVERHAHHLDHGQRLVARVPRLEERAHQVVARARRALLERPVEVALQRDDAVRQLDLALDRLHRLEQRQPVVAPAVKLREVFPR